VFADEKDFGRIVSVPLLSGVSAYGLSPLLNVKLTLPKKSVPGLRSGRGVLRAFSRGKRPGVL